MSGAALALFYFLFFKNGLLLLAELKMYSLMMSANGHVESRGLPPPIIMRTAATPMPTPKSSLGTDSIFSLEESRHGSRISIDPSAYDQRSLVNGLTESNEGLLIYFFAYEYIYIFLKKIVFVFSGQPTQITLPPV